MRIAIVTVLAMIAASSTTFAKDLKYVGVWEGLGGVPIYTKLVFGADDVLTYCSVQSCRQVSCWKMRYRGDLMGKFSYADDLRSFEFEWTDDQKIKATLTNSEGGQAAAIYEPE